MTVICEVIDNVVATYWDKVITAEDAKKVITTTRAAYARVQQPLVAMAIMAETVGRPTLEAGKFMYASHPQMREWHRSIHIVILANGFIATSLKAFVSMGFFDGTGGKLSVHDTVRDAWREAGTFGDMSVPVETMLTWLRANGAKAF